MQVSLIFTFIFAIVMIGLIIAFAIGPISNMFGLSAQAQVYKAVKDIEKLTEEIYYQSLGTSRTYTLTIPGGTKICFIDPNNPDRKIYSANEKWKWWDPDPVVINYMIKDPASQYYQSNVWLYYKEGIGEGYKIARLKTSQTNQNFCAIGGKELFLQNKGPYVEISV
jgi:hypothetical protein